MTIAADMASRFASRPDDLARLTAEARLDRFVRIARRRDPAATRLALQEASEACAAWERVEKGGRSTCGASMDGECDAAGCPQRDPASREDFCPLPATGLIALREQAEAAS